MTNLPEGYTAIAINLFTSADKHGIGSKHRAEEVARVIEGAWERMEGSDKYYLMVPTDKVEIAIKIVEDNGLEFVRVIYS